MDITQTLYVTTAAQWRRWLSQHYRTKRDIWLIFYRKDSGKPRIPYDDAVREALCYGWIDSTVKKLDAWRFAQRFSPRKPTSELSQLNLERIRDLVRRKRMTKAGLAAISHAYDPARDSPSAFAVPARILTALRANPDAWKRFHRLPASYRRVRIAYIESRKRHGPDMYRRALANFVRATAQGKRIGTVQQRRGTGG